MHLKNLKTKLMKKILIINIDNIYYQQEKIDIQDAFIR